MTLQKCIFSLINYIKLTILILTGTVFSAHSLLQMAPIQYSNQDEYSFVILVRQSIYYIYINILQQLQRYVFTRDGKIKIVYSNQ